MNPSKLSVALLLAMGVLAGCSDDSGDQVTINQEVTNNNGDTITNPPADGGGTTTDPEPLA